MKTATAFAAYIIFSGMILGWVKNVQTEQCGTHQRITTGDAVQALLWPMAVGVALTVDEGQRDVRPLCAKQG